MSTPEEQEQVATAIVSKIFETARGEINAAYTQRYLTGIGVAFLIYDHVITFRREYDLVWRAPASTSKYAFLVNRYIVPAAMIPVLWEESGFIGNAVSTKVCQHITTMNFVLGVLSVALANSMILMRVAALWEHHRVVVFLLSAVLLISYSAVLGLIIAVIPKVLEGIQYNPIVGMCVVTKTTPLLVWAWACAIVFEVTILAATCINAIDRPRDANQPLTRALRRDGIIYFALITSCRAVNLVLAATHNPNYAFVAIYFVWNMVTLLVSRLLLRLRALDKLAMVAAAPPARLDNIGVPSRRSFGPTMSFGGSEGWEMKSTGSTPGEVEVGKVEFVISDR